MFCLGFARGQNLAENEFRLNVANYELDFLQELSEVLTCLVFLVTRNPWTG